MIKIKKLAPALYVVVCPARGTYKLTGPTRIKAERLVRAAIEAPKSDWITDAQVHQSLIKLGFEVPIELLSL